MTLLKRRLQPILPEAETESTRGYGGATTCLVGFTPPFLADLAMRGCAISFVMRASVALLDSFLGSFMVPMSTLQL